MSKHTPGPWHVDTDGLPVLQPSATIVRCEAGYRVAEAWGGSTNGVRDSLDNARLIAAAPDLLEVCKRISAAPYGIALGDLERLDAAIARAEGNDIR